MVGDDNRDHGEFMQRPTASQRAEREAPREQVMDLPSDTTGACIQPNQSFEHGVVLLGGRLTMCAVQFAADLLSTDHDRVEAIKGLAPVLAELPFEASIYASVLAEHAGRTTDEVSCDARGDFVERFLQCWNCQLHGPLKAQPLLHELMHARRHGVEDVVIEVGSPPL